MKTPTKKRKQQLSKQNRHTFHHDHPHISLGFHSSTGWNADRGQEGDPHFPSRGLLLAVLVLWRGSPGDHLDLLVQWVWCRCTTFSAFAHSLHCKQAQQGLPGMRRQLSALFHSFSFSSSLYQKQTWPTLSVLFFWLGFCSQRVVHRNVGTSWCHLIYHLQGLMEWWLPPARITLPPYLLMFVFS